MKYQKGDLVWINDGDKKILGSIAWIDFFYQPELLIQHQEVPLKNNWRTLQDWRNQITLPACEKYLWIRSDFENCYSWAWSSGIQLVQHVELEQVQQLIFKKKVLSLEKLLST